MNWHNFVRVWQHQDDATKLCLATGAGLLVAAVLFGLWSLYQPDSGRAVGLAVIGACYLLWGAWCGNWRPRKAASYYGVRPHRRGLSVLGIADGAALQAWENN